MDFYIHNGKKILVTEENKRKLLEQINNQLPANMKISMWGIESEKVPGYKLQRMPSHIS